MNNLEKLVLLEELVKLRRRVMHLHEDVEEIKESTACSSNGPGSRTGMAEEFAQDAEVSSDRKRGHELDESLDNYYRIAGLK